MAPQARGAAPVLRGVWPLLPKGTHCGPDGGPVRVGAIRCVRTHVAGRAHTLVCVHGIDTHVCLPAQPQNTYLDVAQEILV